MAEAPRTVLDVLAAADATIRLRIADEDMDSVQLDDYLEAMALLRNHAADLIAGTRTAERLLSLAEHLFQMIAPEVWRENGGDDGQGHYEGDYHAEQIREELVAARAALAPLLSDAPEDGHGR